MTRAVFLFVGFFMVALAATGARADTLAAVRAAGLLRCGSNAAPDDYTRFDMHGDLTDLADEICKAVAVAVLGPRAKTDLHAWPDERQMLGALRDGAADLGIGATPSVETAAAYKVGFGPAVFYDGLGLLARDDIGSLDGLANQLVCFLQDGTLGETLFAAMRARNVAYGPHPFQEVGEMLGAAGGGRCAAIAGNVSQLLNLRVGFAPIEKRFTLLPVLLTTDPFAPVFPAADPAWGMVVTAVVSALVQAEASGVTAANAARLATSDDPVIAGLIGPRARATARALGLADGWALTVIQAVGNYGEIFDRALGADSDFRLPRGPNQPWSRGGAMIAMPLY